MNRNTLHLMLAGDVVLINFIKHDGTERVMKASRQPKYFTLPDATAAKGVSPDADVCHVFDVDLGQWRAFRYDRLKFVNRIPYVDREPPAVGSPEFIEELAKYIYNEGMRWGRKDETPDWVPGGNAITQDQARRMAANISARFK